MSDAFGKFDLTGKTALVTGGASGIGRASAIAFAREGANVAVADRNRTDGEAVVKQIVAFGGRAIFIEVDVTAEAAIAAMVERTVAQFGGLDAAFNNAGAPGGYSTAATCTTQEWESLIRLNMTSVWLCMKYEIPEMLKRGGGAIVNTSSLSGVAGSHNMFAYVATKHAVVGMTRSAAVDFAAQNIRVNAVCPGSIDTPMLRAAIEGAGFAPEVLVQKIPLKRVGRPGEIADTVVWLCSDRSSYVTGQAINVDGGNMSCCT